jgi:hypothetical protein
MIWIEEGRAGKAGIETVSWLAETAFPLSA